jgi:glycine/serine hydroxymethyltransferase
MSAEEAAAAAIRAAEEADRKRRESLAEMQKRLDEELEKLNHKREIAEKREMFIKCREDIENYIGELEDEEEFETSICRLSFERFTKDGLNREEFKKVMTVSNTAIVKKFCEAMSAEISAKVGEIENELLTA